MHKNVIKLVDTNKKNLVSEISSCQRSYKIQIGKWFVDNIMARPRSKKVDEKTSCYMMTLHHVFIRTLEDNNSGSSDWIYAILDLLESPYLWLYVYQILDELAR